MKTIEYKITVEVPDTSAWSDEMQGVQILMNCGFVGVVENYGLQCHIEAQEVKPDNEVCNEPK